MRQALIVPLLATLCLAPMAAAAAEPDPLVRRQLESLDYRFEVDEDGDYKLVFELDDGRTQLLRVREIWSPAYESRSAELPAAVANRLLADSQDSKVGGWVKQDKYAVFVVKIPAEASADALDDAIEAAFRSADQMEAELTPGKDVF